MTPVRHFRDLRVYQQGFQAARQIFEHSKNWPREERFSRTDQIRRSSRSVCGSIAEAWRKRRYEAHFISKLTDADSEGAETQSWLDFALRCGYLSREDYNHLDQLYEAITGGLVKMMAEPEKWCGPANLLREPSADYEISLES
jgi:four helix bundle protein